MSKTCKYCGAELKEDAKFCASCGARVAFDRKEEEKTESKFDEAAKKVRELNDTADTTYEYDADDIEKNKVFAVLAYFGWLVVIPIFAAKDSKFARFHANQGIVLAIAQTLGWILIGILSHVAFIGIITYLFQVCVFVLMVIGIINAANGRAKDLPLIGQFRVLN